MEFEKYGKVPASVYVFILYFIYTFSKSLFDCDCHLREYHLRLMHSRAVEVSML